MAKYRTNTDWNKATEIDDGGKAAFIQHVMGVTATGAATGTTTDPVITAEKKSATGTVTSVASAAVSTTILAANANRLGATITNTDTNALKLLLAAGTASATNFSVNVTGTNGYFEVPFGYTGVINGIWDVDGTGAALVTEFT